MKKRLKYCIPAMAAAMVMTAAAPGSHGGRGYASECGNVYVDGRTGSGRRLEWLDNDALRYW